MEAKKGSPVRWAPGRRREHYPLEKREFHFSFCPFLLPRGRWLPVGGDFLLSSEWTKASFSVSFCCLPSPFLISEFPKLVLADSRARLPPPLWLQLCCVPVGEKALSHKVKLLLAGGPTAAPANPLGLAHVRSRLKTLMLKYHKASPRLTSHQDFPSRLLIRNCVSLLRNDVNTRM